MLYLVVLVQVAVLHEVVELVLFGEIVGDVAELVEVVVFMELVVLCGVLEEFKLLVFAEVMV